MFHADANKESRFKQKREREKQEKKKKTRGKTRKQQNTKQLRRPRTPSQLEMNHSRNQEVISNLSQTSRTQIICFNGYMAYRDRAERPNLVKMRFNPSDPICAWPDLADIPPPKKKTLFVGVFPFFWNDIECLASTTEFVLWVALLVVQN